MCRLYGLHATEPTKVECTLVLAQNALLLQSRLDRLGRTHPDGWGIAFYRDGAPEVERRPAAAFEDVHFSRTAERVRARTVLAHVRQATVGQVSLENTHPFVRGCWSFAHNGTVAGFGRLERALAAETGPRLQAGRAGTTDSEQLFLWLLAQMEGAGISPDEPCADPETLAGVVGRAIAELARRCAGVSGPGDRPPRLNVLLTDGRVLVAVRWNHDLFWVARDGVHDCEICGIPHIDHAPGAAYRAAVVASEPISHEPWQELPDRSVLLITPDAHARVTPIATIQTTYLP
jgi:glutamine amidotransferase